MKRMMVGMVLALATGSAGFGQEGPRPAATSTLPPASAGLQVTAAQTRPATPRTDVSVTTGSVKTVRGEILYTATAGYMPLKDEQEKLRANIYFTAYTQVPEGSVTTTRTAVSAAVGTEATQPATQPRADANPARPVMFVFNGGPGAASAWLHLGVVGPRKISIPADGTAPKAPYTLVNNEHCWLPVTDIVCVDPVNTGYSRAASDEEAKKFFGVLEDVQAMGEFIRLYLTKNSRWGSPVYLAGESYGTTRAAGLSQYLQERVGVSPSGVILISTVLNFATLSPAESNDLPFALYLPSYTATAWHHGKLGREKKLEDVLKESEAYAVDEYATALMKAGLLSAEEKGKVAGRLAQLTGLRKEYILESNLRVRPNRFEKELLRSPTGEGSKIIGRFDVRLTGFPIDGASDGQEYDPSLSGFYAAYTSSMNDYVRRTLKYENDISYEVLSGRTQPWNFGVGGSGGYTYVGDDLRDAMTQNPNLRILVCSGRYDLATPYFATDYTLAHMTLAPEIRKNIRVEYYDGGHMMYHVRGAIEKMGRDVFSFVEGK